MGRLWSRLESEEIEVKVKDLIKELEYFYLQDEDSEILAYFYDEESDVEYECDFKVDGDIIPLLNLKEIRRIR